MLPVIMAKPSWQMYWLLFWSATAIVVMTNLILTHTANPPFWLKWKKCESVQWVSVWAASWLCGCVKTNSAVFSDAVNMIHFNFSMKALLIELYPFISLSVTFNIFHGHSSVKQFELYMLCSYWVKLKLYDCLLCQVDHRYTMVSIFIFVCNQRR